MRVTRPFLLLLTASLLAACSSGKSHKGPQVPGGSASTDVLSAHGALQSGRVIPPEAPDEASSELRAAYCAYVFGKPTDVGTAARLSGTTTLAKNSGFENLGANGVPLVCTYSVNSQETFTIMVTDGPAPDSAQATSVVTVSLPNDRHGWLGYTTGYTGSTISTADAKAWLTAAGARVG